MDNVLQWENPFAEELEIMSHNPCFSGQCFAIELEFWVGNSESVTILVLVDNVLQWEQERKNKIVEGVTILVLVDNVLQ